MNLYSYSYDTKCSVRKPGNQFEEIAYFAQTVREGHLKLAGLRKARHSALVEAIGEIDSQTFNRLADEIDRNFDCAVEQLAARFPLES
jgi:hypothetical protein